MSKRTKVQRGLSGGSRRCGCSWCLGQKRLDNMNRSKTKLKLRKDTEDSLEELYI